MKISKIYQNKTWLVCLILLLAVFLLTSVFSACAQPVTISDEATKVFQAVQPEDVGLSSEKLGEIDSVLEADISAFENSEPIKFLLLSLLAIRRVFLNAGIYIHILSDSFS